MKRKRLLATVAWLALALMVAMSAQAAVVGRFTMVQGQVDLMKQGKLPAIPVKVQDGVEPGDMIRTKSASKGQVQMVDDSTITLAPESQVAIADYLYDQARGERRAVVRLFRGLVHTTVTRVLKLQEPEFIMETHTATIGVRGTEWYTLLMPYFTTVYLVKGLLDLRSSEARIPAVLSLRAMQFTQIPMGEQPRLAQPLTAAMLQMLRGMMDTGVRSNLMLEGGPAGVTRPGAGPSLLLQKPPTTDQLPLPQPVIPPTVTPPIHTPVTPGPSPGPHGP